MVFDEAYFILDFIEAEDIIGEQNSLIFNETNLVLNLVKTEDVTINTVINLIDGVANIADCGSVADNILDAANLILNLVESEDSISE